MEKNQVYQSTGGNITNHDTDIIEYLTEKLATHDDDAFDYSNISRSLASLITKAKPPFVYAICGSWGSGKSSFLRYLLQHIPRYSEGGVVLYFNAWRSSIYTDIRAVFIIELANQLSRIPLANRRNVDKTEIVECLNKIADSAVQVFSGINPLTKLLSEIYNQARHPKEGGGLVIDEQFGAVDRLMNGFQNLISKITDAKLEPFVIIDEIDRCPPSEVVRIIESLRLLFTGTDELEIAIRKHNGSQKNSFFLPFRFIISIDEHFVAKAFADQYGLEFSDAYVYLSKFIQFKPVQ